MSNEIHLDAGYLAYLLCGGFVAPTEAEFWTFTPLGDLPGGLTESRPQGVSADGSVVAGWSYSTLGEEEAFQWTRAAGMVGLGDLDGGTFDSTAQGVSGDGAIIVGGGQSASGQEAFRRTQSGGMTGLGDLSGGGFGCRAMGISSDGSTTVGWGTSLARAKRPFVTPLLEA